MPTVGGVYDRPYFVDSRKNEGLLSPLHRVCIEVRGSGIQSRRHKSTEYARLLCFCGCFLFRTRDWSDLLTLTFEGGSLAVIGFRNITPSLLLIEIEEPAHRSFPGVTERDGV